MKNVFARTLLVVLLALFPVLVSAAVVPMADAGVEITVPDGWTQETHDKSLTIVSPDKQMVVAFMPVAGDSDSKKFDDIDAAIEKELGKIAWEKDGKGEPTEINGMKGEVYNGLAKEGTVQVECTWLATGPGKNLYVYWFDTVKSEKKFAKEIEVIVKGLKPLAAAAAPAPAKPEEKTEEKKDE